MLFCASTELWELLLEWPAGLPKQIEFFSSKKQFTVVGFDARGYGESRPPTRDFQISPVHFLKQDALDGHQLMQKLGFSQFSVLGWCDGGATGMFMAALFPQSVRKLAIWGTKAFFQKEDIERLERIRDISKWDYPKMRDDALALYGEELPPMWSAMVESSIQVYKNGGDVCKAELKKIQCPTLILHRTYSTLPTCLCTYSTLPTCLHTYSTLPTCLPTAEHYWCQTPPLP